MSTTPSITKVVVPQTVTETTSAPQQPAAKRPPLSVFTQSSFGLNNSSKLAGGVSLPGLSQDQQTQFTALFGGLSDDDRAKMAASSQQLAAAMWQAVGVTPPGELSTGGSQSTGAVQSAAAGAGSVVAPEAGRSLAAANIQVPGIYTSGGGQLVGSAAQTAATYQNASGNNSYDASVAATSYSGLIGVQNDLATYALTVQAQINATNKARQQAADLNDQIANWPEGQDTVQFTWTEIGANGQPVQQSGALTKDQATAKANDMENTISQMGSVTQTQQLQLQQYSQNAQQAFDTLSNLLKSQFDTVKGIINNLRVS